MAESEIVDGRIILHRTDEERKPILERLSRIEGQVRGLRAMIEQDRHCLDEIQQIHAARAALREVAWLIIGQHVSHGLQVAASGEQDLAVADIMSVLRAGMRSQE